MTPPASTATRPKSHVQVDPQVLEEGFADHDFPLNHDLAGHPMFELDALAELADSLPAGQVEHNLGDLPEELPEGAPPRADLTPGEVVRGIETNGCWMVLKRAETDPRYAEILDGVLGEIIDRVAGREGGATRMEGFIMIAAPNSTTPAHIDPEHNVFAHIRGPKHFVAGAWHDPEAKLKAMKRYYGEGHRFIDQMPAGARTYELEPGEGLYLPPHAPHLVKTLDAVAISLSCGFYTKATEDVVNLYSINARLEKLKLPVAEPGRHPAGDRAKAALWRGMRRTAHALSRARGD